MRRGIMAVVLALVAGACATGDDTAALPEIRVTSLETIDRVAELSLTIADTVGPVELTVDWGDDTPSFTFTGVGDVSTTHEYAEDVSDPVVSITGVGEAGGTVRAELPVDLDDVAGSTSTSATATTTTTTTTTVPSTTTTTVPPTTTTSSTTTSTTTSTTSTTTTVAPTTTRAPTTTAAPTTTTLPPEALEQVFFLDFDDATVTPDTEGIAQSAASGDRATLAAAATIGQSSAAQVLATWTIPRDRFAIVGDAPSVNVFLDYTGSLDMQTASANGSSTLFTLTVNGTAGSHQIGTGDGQPHSLREGAEADIIIDEETGFGSPLPAATPIRSGSISSSVVRLSQGRLHSSASRAASPTSESRSSGYAYGATRGDDSSQSPHTPISSANRSTIVATTPSSIATTSA